MKRRSVENLKKRSYKESEVNLNPKQKFKNKKVKKTKSCSNINQKIKLNYRQHVYSPTREYNNVKNIKKINNNYFLNDIKYIHIAVANSIWKNQGY